MKFFSCLKGQSFEDEYDVDEYLDQPTTKWLQISLVIGVIAIIAIAMTSLVS